MTRSRVAFPVLAMLAGMPVLAQSRGAPMPQAPAPAAEAPVMATSVAPRGTTGLMGLRPVEQPPVITLDEAFALAARRSTDLRVAGAQLRAAEANITKAWALVLPQVSLGATYTFNTPEQTAKFGSEEQLQQQALLFRSLGDLTAQSAALNPDPRQRQAALERAAQLTAAADQIESQQVTEFIIQPAHVVDGALTFAMPLFSGRALPLLQNAYGAVALTRLATQQAKAAVLWGVARAYLQAVAAGSFVAIAEEQLASTRRHQNLAEQRAAQGMLTSLAVERTLLDVKKAEQQAMQARGALRMAKAALGGLIGRSEDFEVVAPAAIAAVEDAGDVAALVERAWRQRLDLRVQKETVAVAERTRTEAWTRLLPSVQLVAQGRYTTNTAGLVGEPITGAVMVQASLPVFDGGMTMGTIEEATARLDAELLRVRQVEENIERELRGTLDDVVLKKESVTTTAAVAELAHKQAQNAEELFAQGVATDTDVRDARFAHVAADLDAARARLDLQTARLGLAYALGELATMVSVDDVVPDAMAPTEVDTARGILDRVSDDR
jgi:outer membrane protein TolC